MMKNFFLCAGLSLGLTVAAVAQTSPKPKSMEEQKALQAMFAAQDPDAQISTANTVIEKYADSDFKAIALFTVAAAYQRKGDFPKAVTYGERALEADPANYQAMLVVASEYAQNTHDTDFDKEDKLKKADKYATDAIAAIKAAPKPNPQIPDAQWDEAKKDWTANAYEILGQTAMVRKKPDVAATNFQTAIDTSVAKDPATYVRLAQADNMMGKPDDAIAAAEKAMNSPTAVPAVKQFAQAERARAMQKKGMAGGSVASGSASSAPAPAASAPAAPAPATPPPAAPAPPPAAGSTTPPQP